MTAVASLPRSTDAAVSSAKARQISPGLGLVASVALHGAVLAGIAGWGWGGGQVEPPASIEVTIVMEAQSEAPVSTSIAQPPVQPSASPVVPPRPPTTHPAHSTPRPQAPPPQRTAAVIPPGSSSSDAKPSSMPEPASAGVPAPSTQGGDTDQVQEPAGSASQGEENGGGTGSGATTDGPAEASAGNPSPAYPVAARRAGREGRTVLLVTVGADGECGGVRIEETSGAPSLDEAAVAAVRHWRFTPARRAGKAVEATIRVPVAFRLTATLP